MGNYTCWPLSDSSISIHASSIPYSLVLKSHHSRLTTFKDYRSILADIPAGDMDLYKDSRGFGSLLETLYILRV
jgi:hypothetical protein